MVTWQGRAAVASAPPGSGQLDAERMEGLRAMRHWLQRQQQLMLWRSGVILDYPE